MKMSPMGLEGLMAGSGVTANGIGYGGVDIEGDIEPSAKQHVFDEETLKETEKKGIPETFKSVWDEDEDI